MDSETYEKKLDNLYTLLNQKLDNKDDKYKKLENKYNELEKKYNNLNDSLKKNAFYLNLLYIPQLYKNKTLEDYIFKDKFKTITNSNIKQDYIDNKILSGNIDLNDFLQSNKIFVNTKKNLKTDMSYIVLTLYNKEMLINNYSFNYFLEVKKINNNKFEIIEDLYDYDILFSICKKKKINSDLKIYYFYVDQVFNILK
tara:strand:+ start:398 stop:991 length:594 start_codon:yes stop_codon:yes gene_type:complete